MDTVNAVSNPFLPLLWASKFGLNVAAAASSASTGNTNVATLTADQLPATMADMGTFPWNLDGNSSNHSSLSATNRPDSADNSAKLSANASNSIGQSVAGK